MLRAGAPVAALSGAALLVLAGCSSAPSGEDVLPSPEPPPSSDEAEPTSSSPEAPADASGAHDSDTAGPTSSDPSSDDPASDDQASGGTGSATGQPADTTSGSGDDESPGEPSERSLTFIAMGEDGVGPSVGCGDSAVQVPFTTTTSAPLGEVMTGEVEAEGREYQGDPGTYDGELYNVLWQSDLEYEGAEIDDSGHATVQLSGDLLMGGECDIPRVREQLTAPALQFDNIDDVTVLINGENLDSVLSLQ